MLLRDGKMFVEIVGTLRLPIFCFFFFRYRSFQSPVPFACHASPSPPYCSTLSESPTRHSPIPSESPTGRSPIPSESPTPRTNKPSESPTRHSPIPFESPTQCSYYSTHTESDTYDPFSSLCHDMDDCSLNSEESEEGLHYSEYQMEGAQVLPNTVKQKECDREGDQVKNFMSMEALQSAYTAFGVDIPPPIVIVMAATEFKIVIFPFKVESNYLVNGLLLEDFSLFNKEDIPEAENLKLIVSLMSTENSHVRKHTVDPKTYIPGYYQVLKSRLKVTTNIISMEEL